ncbi:hypothetical protein IG631_04575 [Alternaria alternata]|nr:hypothetical protein IG631_04575 [Alternaria alternata]
MSLDSRGSTRVSEEVYKDEKTARELYNSHHCFVLQKHTDQYSKPYPRYKTNNALKVVRAALRHPKRFKAQNVTDAVNRPTKIMRFTPIIATLLGAAVTIQALEQPHPLADVSAQVCAVRSYGCENGYCWNGQCGSKGEWCWLAKNGGSGGWLTCGSDAACAPNVAVDAGCADCNVYPAGTCGCSC